MNGQGCTMDSMNSQPGLLGDIIQSCFCPPSFPHSNTVPKESPATVLEPHEKGNVSLSNLVFSQLNNLALTVTLKIPVTSKRRDFSHGLRSAAGQARAFNSLSVLFACTIQKVSDSVFCTCDPSTLMVL